MKNHLKSALVFLGVCLSVQVSWFIIGSTMFDRILFDPRWGSILCTAATLCYASVVYTTACRIGKREAKPYSQIKPYPLKGLVIFLPCLIIGAALALSYAVMRPSGSAYGAAFTFIDATFTLWNFTSVSFLPFESLAIPAWVYAIMLVTGPLASALGYLAGMLGFSFFDQVVFRALYKPRK